MAEGLGRCLGGFGRHGRTGAARGGRCFAAADTIQGLRPRVRVDTFCE